MDPKISVIMGIYNFTDENVLRKSIDSIIRQSFSDWELIICDDGSSSQKYSVLTQIARKDKRIKVVRSTENRGLAAALNSAISVANGQYLARQDDDDCSISSRLQVQSDFLDHNLDFSFVGSNAHLVDEMGSWGQLKVPETPDVNSFKWNSPFIHPTVMFRRNDLLSVGGYRVSKETRRCEDYDLFMRMYANGKYGYNIQQNLYDYSSSRQNIKHRKIKYRFDEALVRYKGFRMLGYRCKSYIYIFKPILIGLIPQKLYTAVWKKRNRQ